MKKYVTINAKDFELVNNKPCAFPTNCRSLYECYEKPSRTKIAIYENWVSWFLNIKGLDRFTVSGYNSMTFSLSAVVTWQGVEYLLYITPSHNRAWVIE